MRQLEAERPDVLLVAMGVPRQELWIAGKIWTRAIAQCLLPSARCLTFSPAPCRARRNGCSTLRIEWLYRLWREPKRLWRRYIIGNPVFLASVIKAKLAGNSSARGAACSQCSGKAEE